MATLVTDNSEYVYLSIPKSYLFVYKQLLIKLTALGKDMLDECNSSCKGSSKNLLTCWNMFQTAVAAYANGNTKQSDIIINYIITTLKLDNGILFTNYTSTTPTPIRYDVSIDYSSFGLPIYRKGFVVSENSIAPVIDGINTVIVDNDLATLDKINVQIDNIDYNLYHIRPFVEITNDQSEAGRYYGNVYMIGQQNKRLYNVYYGSVDDLNIANIPLDKSINITVDTMFFAPFNANTQFIAIPTDKMSLKSVYNSRVMQDYLFNSSTGENSYTVVPITINNREYTLYYYIAAMPLNNDLQVNITINT
jgi:hypothetical protein